jgi:integrase
MSEKHVTVWVQNFGDRPYPVLQWYDPDTKKRKSKSAESCNPIDVERARAALEYELNHGLYREASSMSWGRFRALFEDEYFPNCRPETRKVFNTVFDHFERICKPAALRSVTARTVSAFAAGLWKSPGRGGNATMSPWTVKVRLQFLHTALAWAAGQKLIPEVPTFPTAKVPKKKPQPVPSESFERLLAKTPDEPTRVFLLCGWLAGLRRNEALALEREPSEEFPWIDLARGRIVLPAAFTKATEDQWVPLDDELRLALEALPRQGRKVFRFLNYLGRPLTPSGVSLMVTNLAKKAGVKLSMKTLRKGFGCRYAGEVSAQVLQRLMRHSNISVTMDYYANIDEAVENAVRNRRRNSSRNSQGVAGREEPRGVDANPSPETGFNRADESL